LFLGAYSGRCVSHLSSSAAADASEEALRESLGQAALQSWKEFSGVMVAQFRMSLVGRAVYLHLVRHSRLAGKKRLHFSIVWLGRGALMSGAAARQSVRRLRVVAALRPVERSKAGKAVDVRLPEEILAGRGKRKNVELPRETDLEDVDFFEMYREGRLTAAEVNERLRALEELAARKLRLRELSSK
jgi:hypothetical protein